MNKNVRLIGMGCGPYSVSAAGMIAIEEAELILGSKRMMALLPENISARLICEHRTEELYKIISDTPEHEISVLYSGDVGLYSGAPELRSRLLESEDIEVEMIAGVSVLSFFASRIGRAWQDIRVVSAHGVIIDPVKEIERGTPVLFLTSNGKISAEICRRLSGAGFGDKRAVIAERLGYEDERITPMSVSQGVDMTVDDLNVLFVE